MNRSSLYFALALFTVITIGLSLTVTFRRGSSTSGKSAPPRSHSSGSTTATVRTTAEATAQPRITEAYGKLPLSFEENRGQTDPRVKFLARGRRYGFFLTSTEAILTLRQASAKTLSGAAFGRSRTPGRLKRARARHNFEVRQPTTVRVSLVGANAAARVTGLDELPSKANYFLGNDPKKWHTNVPTYARVKYDNAYQGVDLIYYGNQQNLEADFVVAPGADPRMIRFRIQGAKSIAINHDGDLVLKIHGGETLLRKPVAYQRSRNDESRVNDVSKHFVAARYVQKGQREVGFAVESFDARRPLIIDPVLVYSTYLGGNAGEFGQGIAVDAAGNAYVTGITDSTNFPTANPFEAALGGIEDAFVTKLNAAGNAAVYSTYLGGSGIDQAWGIAVDVTGNAYLTGLTSSADFPTANPFQSNCGGCSSGSDDAFVTKLNPAGSGLVYSTYLGGSGGEIGRGIAVDTTGNAYVTGLTQSTDFPTVNPFQKTCLTTMGSCFTAFVTKFNAAGDALTYSTYLGGGGGDIGLGIAVDPAGNAYVTGQTGSTNFPLAHPFENTCAGCPFVTKLNPAGSGLVYSTYLGGSVCPDGPFQGGTGIAADATGNAYVSGFTNCSNFPTANPFQIKLGGVINAFVTKFNSAGTALVYSTYLGGNFEDAGGGISIDAAGDAYVTGQTASTDFPTVNPFQSTCGGCTANSADAFVAEFNVAGNALIYSSYLGGTLTESGSGIAVDGAGNAYVTGTTSSTDFPTVNPVQATYGGNGDAFVTKVSPAPDFAVTSSDGSQTISAGQSAAYPLALAGSSGFSGTVSIACKGVPPASTCSISPNSVSVSGTTASTATVSVATTARPSSSTGMMRRTLLPGPRLWTALACVPAFACVFMGGPRRRRVGLRPRARSGITTVLLFAVLSLGCGGGSSSTKSGTPTGSYTLTVTGMSGSLTHTLNLTLNVN